MKDENIKSSDIGISDDMIRFTRWVLKADDMDNTKRYVYVESGDYFIDDTNRYSWKELYEIYQKELSLLK